MWLGLCIIIVDLYGWVRFINVFRCRRLLKKVVTKKKQFFLKSYCPVGLFFQDHVQEADNIKLASPFTVCLIRKAIFLIC